MTTYNRKETLSKYELFFKQLREDQNKRYAEYAETPLKTLFANGKAFYGSVVGVSESGQLICRFNTKMFPRLKFPMEITLVKKRAFQILGDDFSQWDWSSIKFRSNADVCTPFSCALPIYILKEGGSFGIGRIEQEMIDVVRQSLSKNKELTFVMLEPMPPTEMLMRLEEYIKRHPEDENLTLKPFRTYDEWAPKEITDSTANEILNVFENNDICVLQGPPGAGKTHALGELISTLTKKGNTICVTTQSNDSLMALAFQKSLIPHIENNSCCTLKTVLSAEEKLKARFLLAANKDLTIPKGGLLLSTYYSLSRIINKVDSPLYDLIVIEEASQAYLTAIAAFMKLGKKCLIVGDPMQLPPVVDIINAKNYEGIDIETQANGMMTIVRSINIPSLKISTSYRLTPKSVSQTKVFYGEKLESRKDTSIEFEIPGDMCHFFPKGGGTILYETGGGSDADLSESALSVIQQIARVFSEHNKKKKIAILSPFIATTKRLQWELRDFIKTDVDIKIDTVNRIQGMTVDYTIYYIPPRNLDFAFSENLFNVATSRSSSTTLVLSDMPFEFLPIKSNKVRLFLNRCSILNLKQQGNDITPHKESLSMPSTSDNSVTETINEPGIKVVGKIDLSRYERVKKELSSDKKNYYIIDTNVFVDYPDILSRIDKKYPVILSAKVTDELDKMKIKLDEQKKRNAEKALYLLNKESSHQVIYEFADVSLLPSDFDQRSPDNMILSVALKYKDQNPIMLTSDNGLQLKSKILGISTVSLRNFLKR